MTAEELCRENHGLIYGFAIKHNIELDSEDDMYGLLADAFWNACQTYKDGSTKFSTYAYKLMSNAMITHHKLSRMQKRVVNTSNKVSFDDVAVDGETEMYNFHGTGEFENDVFTKTVVEAIWNVATKRQREFLALLYEGYNLTEIGRIMNISCESVRCLKKNLQKKIREVGICQ